MQRYFFGLQNDIYALLDSILDIPEFRFFEGYSRVDQPIREFSSADEWHDARKEHGRCLLLKGWSHAFTNNIKFKQVVLASHIGGERTCLEGVAVIQIEEARVLDNGSLYPARISHWNEAGARQRSNWSEADLDEVNWPELRRVSSVIQRRLKGLSCGKIGSYPILAEAAEAFESGHIDLWNFGEVIEPGSSKIEDHS